MIVICWQVELFQLCHCVVKCKRELILQHLSSLYSVLQKRLIFTFMSTFQHLHILTFAEVKELNQYFLSKQSISLYPSIRTFTEVQTATTSAASADPDLKAGSESFASRRDSIVTPLHLVGRDDSIFTTDFSFRECRLPRPTL